MPLIIDVYSDVICPWCWIGKRRLDQALATLTDIKAVVRWHPFQLNPGMPITGMPRADYRRRKFGSDDYAQALDARVTKVGDREGLVFDFAAQMHTPNTTLAHRLIWLAGQHDLQDVIVEALFSAYFSAGLDIGNARILTQTASATSTVFQADLLNDFFASQQGDREIQADQDNLRTQKVDGVPLYIINRTERIHGAQPLAVFTAILNQAMSTASDENEPCSDGFCRP
jgi:predicted DsbA family dithiol-disulfide isomerase